MKIKRFLEVYFVALASVTAAIILMELFAYENGSFVKYLIDIGKFGLFVVWWVIFAPLLIAAGVTIFEPNKK